MPEPSFATGETRLERLVWFSIAMLPAGASHATKSLLGDVLVNLLVILALLPAFFVIFGILVLISMLLGDFLEICSDGSLGSRS